MLIFGMKGKLIIDMSFDLYKRKINENEIKLNKFIFEKLKIWLILYKKMIVDIKTI